MTVQETKPWLLSLIELYHPDIENKNETPNRSTKKLKGFCPVEMKLNALQWMLKSVSYFALEHQLIFHKSYFR